MSFNTPSCDQAVTQLTKLLGDLTRSRNSILNHRAELQYYNDGIDVEFISILDAMRKFIRTSRDVQAPSKDLFEALTQALRMLRKLRAGIRPLEESLSQADADFFVAAEEILNRYTEAARLRSHVASTEIELSQSTASTLVEMYVGRKAKVVIFSERLQGLDEKYEEDVVWREMQEDRGDTLDPPVEQFEESYSTERGEILAHLTKAMDEETALRDACRALRLDTNTLWTPPYSIQADVENTHLTESVLPSEDFGQSARSLSSPSPSKNMTEAGDEVFENRRRSYDSLARTTITDWVARVE
jgi:hypothetical protein